jgi:CRISPR system Cascade subunit CasC
MLIEVHIIQNHAPSNLNRDDSGSPKSAIFGGYRRARISSQCLKRCYRTSKTFRDEVDNILGMHTTSMPAEVIQRASSNGVTFTDDEQKALKAALAKVVKKGEGGSDSPDLTEREEAESQEVEKAATQKDKLKTAQSVFWRERELNALAEGVRSWASGDRQQDFDPKSMLKPVGLNWAGIPVDMALFGRMVTSDLMHNVEASSQFAHAISTHEFASEFDLWTRVDDRRDKRLDFYRDAFGAEEKLESGTDGMGDAEFTSACFYGYFNVDFDALVDNLTGKALNRKREVPQTDADNAKRQACKAVIGLLKAAIFERPTGKFNSMATPSLPTLVLVEVRDSHVPVSYADAFAKPVDPKNEETQSDTGQVQRVDLRIESAKRLIQEANRTTKAFCRKARKRLVFTGGQDVGALLENGAEAPAVEVESVCKLVEELRTALECPKEKQDV